MEPSPRDIEDLAFRLKDLNDNLGHTDPVLLNEISALGAYSNVLIPALAAAIRRGIHFPSVQLVPVIVGLRSSAQNSACHLLGVAIKQYGDGYLNFSDKCVLLVAGFPQFEEELLMKLRQPHCYKNDVGGLRDEIVDALKKAGTQPALTTLRNIDWKTGSSINEMQTFESPEPEDEKFFEKLMCNARLSERKDFHIKVVDAIKAVESRLSTSPIVGPATAATQSDGEPAFRPEDLCRQIENNLVDFVLAVLKASSATWWNDFVPLQFRQECSKRQEEEGNRFQKEAYLDLLSLKTVMHKNWKLFEPYFRALGFEGGKDKTLAWMDQLNELRRIIGHPLKKHVSGYTFSKEELQFLVEYDSVCRELATRAPKPPT